MDNKIFTEFDNMETWPIRKYWLINQIIDENCKKMSFDDFKKNGYVIVCTTILNHSRPVWIDPHKDSREERIDNPYLLYLFSKLRCNEIHEEVKVICRHLKINYKKQIQCGYKTLVEENNLPITIKYSVYHDTSFCDGEEMIDDGYITDEILYISKADLINFNPINQI